MIRPLCQTLPCSPYFPSTILTSERKRRNIYTVFFLFLGNQSTSSSEQFDLPLIISDVSMIESAFVIVLIEENVRLNGRLEKCWEVKSS